MFFNRLSDGRQRSKCQLGAALLAMMLMALSCTAPRGPERSPAADFVDGEAGLPHLARRFAPRLYLQADEPYEIEAVIVVFHPTLSIIAYHIFFEDDALYSKKRSVLHHELVWIQYDPVTLKIMDVVTFWHRTTLRTDDCVLEARGNQQRPRIEVQWGQHGLLPWGWRNLNTARPRLELALHYSLVARPRRSREEKTGGGSPLFEGSYEQYLQLTEHLDISPYIREDGVMVAEHPDGKMGILLRRAYAEKKEWPHW